MSLLLHVLSPVLRWYSFRQSKRSLADYDKSYTLRGLAGKVEVLRDRWAVPHIYAQSQEDLFLAQGFAHAQDRLWQMELMRRVASGRLSEIFGDKTLEGDKMLRTLGFGRLAEEDIKAADKRLLGYIERYAEGVNAYIAECVKAKALPVEFKLLGFQPKAWTAADTAAISRFLAFQMSFGWLHQAERLQWLRALGADKAAELFIQYPQDNPTVLHMGIETYEWVNNQLSAFNGPFLRPIGGSNSWVIAAHKMEDTQSAVLANDPHLVLTSPNIWIENHLICPDYECTGVSVPGVPFVLIGHNRHVAWGATLSFVDMQDLYIERFTSPECKQYEAGKDTILRATHVEETIVVKGQKEAVRHRVVYTHHGPIISDLLGQPKEKISLASPALQKNQMIEGFYALNTASDWNSFVGAASLIHAPSLNLSYADTSDNIGYFCTGKVPIRKKSPLGLPLNGFDGAHEWTDFVPSEEMPHAFNPERGYLYTCNNRVVDDKYPYDLGDLWMNGYRADRLQELFDEKKKYTIEDCKKWQNDLVSTAAKPWVKLFEELLNVPPFEGGAKANVRVHQACAMLAKWDGYTGINDPCATVFHVFLQCLIDMLIGEYAPALRGKTAAEGLFKHSEFWSHDTGAILRIIQNPDSHWHSGNKYQTIQGALTKATDYLYDKLGGNPITWHWGRLHQITFEHALGAQPPFDKWFNISNIPIGGDKDTLNQQSFMPDKHYGGTICGASFRQIINMGNLADSYCVAPLGQSGNLKSPHQQDQLPLWLNGEYKPMLWTRQQIQEHTRYRAELLP